MLTTGRPDSPMSVQNGYQHDRQPCVARTKNSLPRNQYCGASAVLEGAFGVLEVAVGVLKVAVRVLFFFLLQLTVEG